MAHPQAKQRKGGEEGKIKKKHKTKLVFNEAARKEFLTGFRKRKDERKAKGKLQLEKKLADEVRKVKEQARKKLEKSRGNASNKIVPEVAHLLDIVQNSTTTITDIGDHSVSVTSLEDLSSMAAPWRKDHSDDSESEDEELEEVPAVVSEWSVPGMDLKQAPPAKKQPVFLDAKEKKNINKTAIKMLHTSKAFKAKEKIKAKKQRNGAKFGKIRSKSKRAKHHNSMKETKKGGKKH